MPNFAYRAVDAAGKRSRGELPAANAALLTRSLEERGLLVLEVAEAAPAGGKGGGSGSRRDVLEVTRALGSLLPVGMPLAQALQAASGVASGVVQSAILDVRERVERGDPLSAALAAHPRLFSPLYVGLVRAGERSGDLDSAFGRLAIQLERDEQLRGRVLSAAIYPMLLAAAGTSAILVLVFYVLPQFVGLLQGSGAELPRSTAALLWISSTMRRFWPVLLAIPAIGAMLVTWVRTTPAGKRAWSQFLLAVPLISTLRQYALAARFARLVGVLLGGGAPLLTALDDTIESLDDPLARDDATRIRARVREGVALRAAVADSPLYPPLLAQLIGVGEDAGELRAFLLKAAEIFEERTERATQRLATLAEPAMIMIFGVIVAFVALSLLQAIYGINANSFK
ncbi:MAG: type II secretion system F family protein [Gemmatimonadetes bacterium]|jgi:general secretion pathway protein F|nr:type II secretion system F family protein [Gemmatimonadota bacterium]MBK9549648.1 type II secretion system F family protein [Gemmatimonadota bacterium]